MTTETEKQKILANVDLEVYLGEDDVFVRVIDPKDPTIDNWPDIQRFYRWSAAKLGKLPEDIWNPRLGYAVLSKRHFTQLTKDFSVKVISEKAFFKE